MKVTFFSGRRRKLLKLAGALAALAALAGIVASVAFGRPRQRPVTLHLHIVQVAKIGDSGSTLAIHGSVACRARRLFSLGTEVLEPASGASVHGSIPSAGAPAPTCTALRKSFTIVATQEGQAKPRALTPGTSRACFFIHSWARRGAATLDARCFTLRASHS